MTPAEAHRIRTQVLEARVSRLWMLLNEAYGELNALYDSAPTECGYEYVSPTNVVYLKDVAR